MAKPRSDQLFRLIKSLSKAEKRYFNLYTSRLTIGKKNNYVILFRAIDNQQEYDEKSFEKFFKKQSFQTPSAIAKGRLYEIILKSLDAFHADSSINVEIRKLLHYTEILFKKSLYEESEKMLLKAKRIAVQYEKYNALLEVLNWEKKLMEKGSYAGNTLEDLANQLTADESIIEKITNYSEFWNLKSRLFILLNKQGKARDNAELAAFKKIIDTTLLKSENKALSYESKYLYFQIYSAYYFGISDYKNSYAYIKKHLKLIEANQNMFLEEPNKYFAVLSNMIYLCSQLKKFNEIPVYLGKLKAIAQNVSDDRTEDLEIKLFATTYSVELSLYIQTAAFEKALLLIPIIEAGLEKYHDKINKVRAAYFFFNISIVYFSVGNFSKALSWINKLLNEKSVDSSMDIHCFAKIFNLIIHLEMGNNELIPYAFKSTMRYLEKRNRIYKFETVFFDFLKMIQKAANAKAVRASYVTLRNDLKTLSNDSYEKTVFEYFDFVSWAESKIEQTSFETEAKKKLIAKPSLSAV